MRSTRWAVAGVALAAALTIPPQAMGQTTGTVSGVVVDLHTGAPVPNVLVRIEGSEAGPVTEANGAFRLAGVTPGSRILLFEHLAYGEHRLELDVSLGNVTISVGLSVEAIELDPLVVSSATADSEERRARGASQWVVSREEIQAAIGTSRHVGDLMRQTIPGLHLRQSNDQPGQDVCLEFRGAAQQSIVSSRACHSPMVYLDGIEIQDPHQLYGLLDLETLEEVEVLPPGQAGARYGPGSLYGVILIETRRPGSAPRIGSRSGAPLAGVRSSFDWSLEPAGHNTKRTFFAAFAGNTLAMAGGVALARQCIGVDAKDEIVTACSGGATAGVGMAAVLLPALGASLGGVWGGATDRSRGRFGAAALGAAISVLPGYAFSLATVGPESGTVNAIGYAFLLIGVPAAVTIADRLFRNTR